MPTPKSRIAQDVLEQTEMLLKDVPKKVKQAYIEYKSSYLIKEPNLQKLNEQLMCISLNKKRIIKEAKFPLHTFNE